MPADTQKKEKEKEKGSMPIWKLALIMPYLISQIVLWAYVFICLLPERHMPITDYKSWTFDQYWRADLNFPYWLAIAQSLQLVDVVFSFLGISQNNIITVFVQIASRYMILFGFMPFVAEGHYSIFMSCICWSITEVTRFTLYALKNAGVDMTFNYLGDLVSHARYTFFIVLYPVGITGELIACYKAWEYLSSLGPDAARPSWTYYPLPNQFNVSFIFEDIIWWAIPLAYIIGFPPLYQHMWVQRAKHYKTRQKMIKAEKLKVPEKFKNFIEIKGLQKLQFEKGKKTNPMILPSQAIEHTKGEVLLIDFWAIWCPPCQRPMAHNQEMMTKNAQSWQDKQTGRRVRIIGLSIDKSVMKMQAHVCSKGWTSLENYVVTDQKPMNQYEVQGIPHVMLVDQNGQVVFKGHPGHRLNLANDLDRLFRGLPLL